MLGPCLFFRRARTPSQVRYLGFQLTIDLVAGDMSALVARVWQRVPLFRVHHPPEGSVLQFPCSQRPAVLAHPTFPPGSGLLAAESGWSASILAIC